METKPNVIEYLVGKKIDIPEKVVTNKVSINNLEKNIILNLEKSVHIMIIILNLLIQ